MMKQTVLSHNDGDDKDSNDDGLLENIRLSYLSL